MVITEEIIAAYIERIGGLATCSVIFTEECVQSDLDENGRLQVATFIFEPVDENYDLNEFYFWAGSLVVGEKDIYEDISGKIYDSSRSGYGSRQ